MADQFGVFQQGKVASASALNAIADVCRAVNGVAGTSGISANLINGRMQIQLSKYANLESDLHIGLAYNKDDVDLTYGDVICLEKPLYENFGQNQQYTDCWQGGQCDFADDDKDHKPGVWAICLEEIKAKATGRVCLDGICLAKVTVYIGTNETEPFIKYATLEDEEPKLHGCSQPTEAKVLWHDSLDGKSTGDSVWALIQFHLKEYKGVIIKNADAAYDIDYCPQAMEIKEAKERYYEVQAPLINCDPDALFTCGVPIAMNKYGVVNLIGPHKTYIEYAEGEKPVLGTPAGLKKDLTYGGLVAGYSGFEVLQIIEDDPDCDTIYDSAIVIPERLHYVFRATEDADESEAGKIMITSVDSDGYAYGEEFLIKLLPEEVPSPSSSSS